MKEGYQPAGPLTKKGIPNYLGRYVNKNGRLVTLTKPSYVFNKYDYNQVFSHAIHEVAYNWNQFVASMEGLDKVFRKKANWDKYVAK